MLNPSPLDNGGIPKRGIPAWGLGKFASLLVALPIWVLLSSPAQGTTPNVFSSFWRAGISLSVQKETPAGETLTRKYLTAFLDRVEPWGDVGMSLSYTTLQDGMGNASEGMGDLIVHGRISILDQQGVRPDLNLIGLIKFPTADEEKGLGTGERDLTAGFESGWFLSDSTFALFDMDYTGRGNPPGEELKNQIRVSVGGGTYFTPVLVASLSAEWRSAEIPGESDAVEILLAMNRAGTVDAQGVVNFGVSGNAPDYGVTTGIVYRW